MANLLRPTVTGMSPRNIALLRQLEEEAKFDALMQVPRTILEEVRHAGEPTAHLAQKLQTAVAIAIECHTPLRTWNLRRLRIGIELVGGNGRPMFITVTGEGEVKNNVPIDAALPTETAKLMTLYIERYLPLLTKDKGGWLFPGAVAGQPKSDDGLRSQIQKMLAKRCGLVWHTHLFRHMCAWIILRHNPEAHGLVQRVLGHKKLSTTMDAYSGLETAAALEHYDRLVTDLRDKASASSPRKRRSGLGR